MELFFFNDTATTEIYTLSLHDALPVSLHARGCASRVRKTWRGWSRAGPRRGEQAAPAALAPIDRKSTSPNSSHANISDAAFWLKKITTPQSPSMCSPTAFG